MKFLVVIGLIAGAVVFGLGILLPKHVEAKTLLNPSSLAPGKYMLSTSWCGPCNYYASAFGYEGNYEAYTQNLGKNVTYLNGDQYAIEGLSGVPNYFEVDADGKIVNLKTGYDGSTENLEKMKTDGIGSGPSKPLEMREEQQPPKQDDQVICIVPRPGQSPDFGPVTDEPGIYRPGGFIQDTDLPIKESKKNYDLRYLGGDTMAVQIAQAEVQAPESATKKTIHPDGTQAQQFIESMGGNPKNRGSYKINGTDVPVGQYLANHKNQETGITFDDKCENPKQEGKAPDPGKTTPPGGGANPGFGSPGNGGGFGNFGNGGGGFGDGGGGLGGLLGGGGAGGGLAALLPLLMQGLMGGGQGGLGGQQGYGQQGQYGAGYGNQQQQPPCANQPIAPACGTDGNTYKNSCYANQQGAILRSTGICAPVVPSPIPTINSIVTLTQLSQSGIPATLLENVRNLVSSVLSNILSGSAVSETTVN